MELTKREYGVKKLQELVAILHAVDVDSVAAWREWKKDPNHLETMNRIFDYPALRGMPPVNALVDASFHPHLPLVLFNYSPVAHNTLYMFPDGWTVPLRLCRGIVFDLETTELVALPFPKFFNYGEHPETLRLSGLFEATLKYDGHLGIIFHYRGKKYLTTRGDFGSPSSKLGNRMLEYYQLENHHWQDRQYERTTLLVEIIHPNTHVHVNYDGAEQFKLVGAMSLGTLKDFTYPTIELMAHELGISRTKLWTGNSLDDLVALMQDRTVRNTEGYVLHFPATHLRCKLKFATYIGLMVAAKLSYSYLMRRYLSGNLQRMLDTLDEELMGTAMQMLGRLLYTASTPGKQKDKWRKLYELEPADNRTSSFETACREFVKSIAASAV